MMMMKRPSIGRHDAFVSAQCKPYRFTTPDPRIADAQELRFEELTAAERALFLSRGFLPDFRQITA